MSGHDGPLALLEGAGGFQQAFVLLFMATQVHAAHILVKTEAEANTVLADLLKGKKFEEIAKEKSLCPSKRDGGDLGWFRRGMMVRPFENAAFDLKKGDMCITKTDFGCHIIKKVDEK